MTLLKCLSVITLLQLQVLYVNSEQCVVKSHQVANKEIHVESKSNNDSILVILSIEGKNSKPTNLRFRLNFDRTSEKPVLENMLLNNKLLCSKPISEVDVRIVEKDVALNDEPVKIEDFSDIVTLDVTAPKLKPTDYYYWKKYAAVPPSDAFVATVEKSGRKVFIGSGIYQNPVAVMPGPTYKNDAFSYSSAFSRLVQTNHNVQILCSPYKDKLAWIKVHLDDIKNLTNCHFVQGGYEFTYPGPLLVGRLKVGEEDYAIGKVILNNDKFKGFESFHNGKHYFRIMVFEALGFCE